MKIHLAHKSSEDDVYRSLEYYNIVVEILLARLNFVLTQCGVFQMKYDTDELHKEKMSNIYYETGKLRWYLDHPVQGKFFWALIY